MSAQDGMCSEGNAQQSYPSLCKNGCGFFSSVDAKGFCSVCYKDFLKKEQRANEEDQVASATASLSNLNVSVEPEEDVSKVDSTEPMVEDCVATGAVAVEEVEVEKGPEVAEKKVDEEEVKETKKPKKNRCASCKKKVGLTGFNCRCGGMFCGLHRYSDKHDCSFDYNALGKEEISKANPVIVAEKVAKI